MRPLGIQRIIHTQTHAHTKTHTYTHIYKSSFEWVFIDTLIWYVWLVLRGNSQSWLVAFISPVFLAFYLFQLWKLFTRVAKTKARINKRKAWKRLLLLLSWLVYNYPGFLLPLFTQIFPLLPSFLASSKQTFTAQLFLERSFVVNWWVLNCFVGPMNILWYTSFTFTFHFPIFFGRFSTLLLKFMHNQQS